MWRPNDIGRDSWDWVGPPAWGRACFNSPEWGGGSSTVKTEPPQIVLLLLLLLSLLSFLSFLLFFLVLLLLLLLLLAVVAAGAVGCCCWLLLVVVWLVVVVVGCCCFWRWFTKWWCMHSSLSVSLDLFRSYLLKKEGQWQDFGPWTAWATLGRWWGALESRGHHFSHSLRRSLEVSDSRLSFFSVLPLRAPAVQPHQSQLCLPRRQR